MANIQKYYKWYEKQYGDIANIKHLKKLSEEKNLKTLATSCDDFKFLFSSIWRHENMANLKFIAAPRKTDYSVTIFKISRRDTDIQHRSSYAFLYSYIDVDEFSKIKPNPKNYHTFIKHEFVSFSPTYKSADGEYRHRFVPVKQLINHRSKHVDIFDDIESMAIKAAKKGKTAFETSTYYPTNITSHPNFKEIQKAFIDSLDLERYVLIFYACIWVIEFKRKIENETENHIVDGFINAMFSPTLEDEIPVWEKHKEFLTKHSGKFYHNLIRILPAPDQKTLTTECGQKFILLNTHDMESMNDIRLAPWREMFIRSLVGDLVINCITPGVPIMNDWFLIPRDKDLFDNRVSHVKMDHSFVASDIIKKLESARKGTYVIDPAEKNEIYISYKMNGFSQAIEIPMDYAEREIVLADQVLVALEEHLGRTVADIPILMMNKWYQSATGPIFRDQTYFKKYVFGFIYALWCLNSKFGISHGDLHLNNVTLFQQVSTVDAYSGNDYIKNPYCVFGVGSGYYIFPHLGRHSAIIDFSRSFVWNPSLDDHFTENQVLAIQRDNKKRMIQILQRDLPDFMSTRLNDMELVVERHFEESYKVFQALDTWKLMNGMSMLCNQILTNPDYLREYADAKTMTSELIPFLETIRDAAFDFVTKYYDILIEKTSRESVEIPEPNKLFLEKFFQEFRIEKFSQDQPINLVDVFRDSNEMKYNIREYDKFPPTVSLDYVVKNKIPIDKIRIDRHAIIKQHEKKNPPEESLQKIAIQVIESKPDRRGTPELKPDQKQDSKKIADKIKMQIESQDDLYFSS